MYLSILMVSLSVYLYLVVHCPVQRCVPSIAQGIACALDALHCICPGISSSNDE